MTTTGTPSEPRPLQDYASVCQAINSLPPVAPGRVRVFRGQTDNYSKMLATRWRPGQKMLNSSLFNLSTRVVAQDLFTQPIDTKLELNMMMFWLQAVAQHYGPGSPYLDVTHSVETALWFALHESENHEVKTLFGPGTEPDPKNDIVRIDTWLGFRRSEKTGYLYVFDVPKWKPGESAAHGDLIDLAEAPEVFFSNRMRAQSGCLMASGPDPEKTDLSDCYATAPIPIAWPMTGASGLDRATEDIFPGPKQDSWYNRFLSIPLVPQPDPATLTQLTMGHPLPVTIYLPDQRERARDLMACENGFHPALVSSAIGDQIIELYDPSSRQFVNHALRDATVLILESPLRFVTPPAEYDGWNQGLLCGDISDRIPAYDASSAEVGSVSLHNVFVEFSPLETAELSRAEDARAKGLQTVEVLRAAWLVRDGSQLSVNVFYSSLPSNRLTGMKKTGLAWDSSTGTIRYPLPAKNAGGSPGEIEWDDFTKLPLLPKPLFTALLVLRELSPILKVAPFPALVTDAGTEAQKMFVTVSRNSARLLRVLDPRSSKPLHFVRSLELNESFISPRRTGAMVLDVKLPFSKLDPAWIRNSLAANADSYKPEGAA